MLLRKTPLFFYIVLFFIPAFVGAQKNNANWYFGRNAAIEFIGTPPTATLGYDNAMYSRATACVSDSVTGYLLFYTDGASVWNKNHTIMANGTGLIAANASVGTLIVPYPEKPSQYFIFSVAPGGSFYYSVVDMDLNGGLGAVTQKSIFLALNTAQTVMAVKHQYSNRYWLITHSANTPNDNAFLVYPITATGVKHDAVKSFAGNNGATFGDLVSNHKGDKIAITHYADAGKAYAQVFDFDKQCGTVSNAKTLYKDAAWDYAYGAAFSADDSKLYIAYGYIESQLVQYSGNDFSSWGVVATSDQNFNDILLGPDNRLYISTHDNNVPSPIIDALLFPSANANAVAYTTEVLHLGAWRSGNFDFPNLMTDESKPQPASATHGLSIGYKGACITDSTKLFVQGNANIPDSVVWNITLPDGSIHTSRADTPTVFYGKKGKYWASLSWYRCGLELIIAQQVNIIEAAEIKILGDTVLCHGDSVTLKTNAQGLTHLWNTGQTTDSIRAKKGGLYWVQVKSGSCNAADSTTIKQYPPIMVALADGFTVCEHDTANLIKLDAGKGYSHYKWTPTGDTTQWIIVKQAGEYYVVVEDYRGCKGGDGSAVARLCNFDFYMPNAFTPNGDGINDVFMPTAADIYNLRFEIYNTWGQLVFSTNNPLQGWDGTYKNTPCPQGVYMYKISFKGYSNKLLKNFNLKGNISLLR